MWIRKCSPFQILLKFETVWIFYLKLSTQSSTLICRVNSNECPALTINKKGLSGLDLKSHDLRAVVKIIALVSVTSVKLI